jgi:hypothetical protein
MWFKRSDGILFEVAEGSESHRLMMRDGGFEEVPSSVEQNSETTNTGVQPMDAPPAKPLEKMTVAELRAEAAKRNVTLEGNLSKGQIVAFLQGLGG